MLMVAKPIEDEPALRVALLVQQGDRGACFEESFHSVDLDVTMKEVMATGDEQAAPT
jgi:hypothetical protein